METFKKYSLRSSILFLSLGALMAISTVLFGDFSGFGTEIKMILSTGIISSASICCLCCSAFASKKEGPNVGYLGLIFVAVASACMLFGLWFEISEEFFWKFALVQTILAVTFSHFLVLLSLKLPNNLRWVHAVTTLSILLMGATLCFIVVMEAHIDTLIRPISALSIAIAFESILIPILSYINKNTEIPFDKGHFDISKRADGLYQDKEGRIFELKIDKKKNHAPHLGALTANGLR